MAQPGEPRDMPDLAIFRLIVIGVELVLGEGLVAAGAKVIVLTAAPNFHNPIGKNWVRIETFARPSSALPATGQSLGDAFRQLPREPL